MRKWFGTDGCVTSMRKKIFTTLEAVLFALVTSVFMVVIIQVLARYVFKASTPWAGELSQILLVWMVMVGAAAAMERKEHYVISFVIDLFPARLRTAVLVVSNTIGAVFLLLLVNIGWAYFQDGFSRTYVITGIPHATTFLSLPIAAAMMLFSMVSHSLDTLADRAHPKHTEEYEKNPPSL